MSIVSPFRRGRVFDTEVGDGLRFSVDMGWGTAVAENLKLVKVLHTWLRRGRRKVNAFDEVDTGITRNAGIRFIS